MIYSKKSNRMNYLFLRSEKSSFFVQQKEQSPWLPLLFSKFLNSMNQITDWQIIAVEVVGGGGS